MAFVSSTRAKAGALVRWINAGIAKTILAKIFVLIVFPLGLVTAILTPPGLVGDEPAQMIRAEALLHGSLIGSTQIDTADDGRQFTQAGMRADPALLGACLLPNEVIDGSVLSKMVNQRWSGKNTFLELGAISINFPIFYVLPALGMELTKAVGGRPYQAIFVARLFAYVGSSVIGLLALIIAKRGQAMIFVSLALPMTVSLAASCDPDGPFIAVTALAAACMSRGYWRRSALLLSIVILVKPPYALLALAYLLPLPPIASWKMDWRMMRRRAGEMTIIFLPPLLWLLYALVFVQASVARPAYHPGPLWPGDPNITFYATNVAAQMRVVLAHPLVFLTMVWNNFYIPVYRHNFVNSAIGILNWLKMPLPDALYSIWIYAIIGAAVADCLVDTATGPGWQDTLVLVFVIVATVVLVWLSEYLTWTEVGMTDIAGPQGRYLLPLLPIFGLALPRVRFVGDILIRRIALMLPISASFVTLLVLPAWMAIKFFVVQ